jgi:hypothetical protein
MYVKLNFTNTVSWATVFGMIRTILTYNINSVSDLTAGATATSATPAGYYTATAGGGAIGQPNISLTNVNIVANMLVTGTGVPVGTYVQSYTTGTVVLTKNLTATASGTYTFSTTNFNDGSQFDATQRTYFDPTNSEIFRTTAASGGSGILPGVGFGSPDVPWCYFYSGTPITSPFQDIVIQRSLNSNNNIKYYVRLRFDGLNLYQTPFKTADTTASWLQSGNINSAGTLFNTQNYLSNGSENCIGYNMTNGCNSFFMFLTPTSILIGGKGPTGTATTANGWIPITSRAVGVVPTNTTTIAYDQAGTTFPSGAGIPTVSSPAGGSITGPIATVYSSSISSSVNTWTPTPPNASVASSLVSSGLSITGTGITTIASPTTLVGWSVNNITNNINHFGTVHSVTGVTGTSGSWAATINIIGGSNPGTSIPTTGAGLPFNASGYAPGSYLYFYHPPYTNVINVIPDGSKFSTTTSVTNSILSNNFYAKVLGPSTVPGIGVGQTLKGTGINIAHNVNLSGASTTNTTGNQGLASLHAGNFLNGTNSIANTLTQTIAVDGYPPHNPYHDAVSLYGGQALFGPAFVSEYQPFDATAVPANGAYTVLFNGGYQYHAVLTTNTTGAPKSWYGMSAQDFLHGDPNTISKSYKVLNLRAATPNVAASWTQDILYAPVYIGTDARTIERAPLGDINTGTTSGALVSDRTLAAALTDQPSLKFPDVNKNPAFGLFPLVWSNSNYNMAGGKLTPLLAGFMLFNGDYSLPDDYFTFTPSGGSTNTYAVWPMADGFTRRLGIAVPKA